MTRNDTIAAIATAPGRAGVAVVRVSGPDAFAVGGRVAGRALSPGLRFVRTPYDECLVLGFRNPKSYTGEDVVEFQCHGGDVTPRRILEACFAAGARLAHRGEFTERAFLNGKLDCVQAESVLDLINAKTSRAADAALAGLSGRSQSDYRALYETALALSTQLEHALDISEEELPESFFADIRAQFTSLVSRLTSSLSHAHEGKLLRNGALVVLAGPPNAGKSSLLNALLGENRAIVSEVPGTTRDSIEEWMDLEGYPVRLVDTAGLRATGDAIEAEGVRRSEELIARADVVVDFSSRDIPVACEKEDYVAKSGMDKRMLPYCRRLGDRRGNRQPLASASRGGRDGTVFHDPPSQTLPHYQKENVIHIHSKCDLSHGEGLNVSAKTGEGLDALKQRIVEILRAQSSLSDGDDSPSERAMAVLLEVKTLLLSVSVAGADCDLVLAANALRQAAESLGTLVGATYSSDLMDRLFSRFCVGK